MTACRHYLALGLRLPWLLLHFDAAVAGREIVKRSRTKRALLVGEWSHLTDDYAIARLDSVAPSAQRHCDCPQHKEKRRHTHPCAAQCGRVVACGTYACWKQPEVAQRRSCRRCGWAKGFGKPATDDEIKRYNFDVADAKIW